MSLNIEALDWEKVDGLVPAIVQDVHTAQVLMLGYMNREALEHTQKTGKVTFFSRTKQRLWTKGETSGHVLKLDSICMDCDHDTLLVLAQPHGPTCHLGQISCFGENVQPNLSFAGHLGQLIQKRKAELPEGSYTTSLFEAGIMRIAQKVGEEGVETALAAVGANDESLLGESADILYHLLVLLAARELSLEDVMKVLQLRHASA